MEPDPTYRLVPDPDRAKVEIIQALSTHARQRNPAP
jgi:hypothetical protein